MTFRRIAAVVCVVFIMLTFVGCNPLDTSIESLLSPPKQDGDVYKIHQALEASVGKDITLKYPIAGEYRSAFCFKDVDGDDVEEALALYSISQDGAVSMHLNVIDYLEEEWISRSDTKVVGNGVEKIDFCDLDGDSVPEIIVGWMIYGTVDKQVGVYSYDGNVLNQRIIEKYSDFMCNGIYESSAQDELIVLNLDSTAKASTLKVLSLNESGVDEVGSVMLDGSVTSYSTPIVSKLSNGKSAIFIDAIKGTGSLTEVVWFDGDMLKSIYDAKSADTSLTYRPSIVSVRDIDDDGVLDIPVMSLLKSTINKPDTDKVFVTSWSAFDGKRLTVKENCLMNYTDGYYIKVDNDWMNTLHLARKIDSGLRIFYSYDAETDTQGNEVFRIVSMLQSDIESGKFDASSYEVIGNNDGKTYLAKTIPDNEQGITVDMIRKNFYIIK